MKLPRRLLLLGALLASLAAPAVAHAAFGIKSADVSFTNSEGAEMVQAGGHPDAMVTKIDLNAHSNGAGGELPDDQARDIEVTLPEGFAGDPTSVPRCSDADFLGSVFSKIGEGGVRVKVPACPDSTVLGTVQTTLGADGKLLYGSVYNLVPPPGKAAKLGFEVVGVRVVVEAGLSEKPPYRLEAHASRITQTVEVLSSKLTLWGVPADSSHDELRGSCLFPGNGESLGKCPVSGEVKPFITLPRACEGPLATTFAIDSWAHPGARLANGNPDLSDPAWITETLTTHDGSTPPEPFGFTGCGKVGLNATIESKPTSEDAETGSGLDFSLDVHDPGLTNPEGNAGSDIKKAVVALPEGVTVNPSVAEGLEVCTPAQVARETAFSAPGEGCPQASKLGTLHVVSSLVEEPIDGSIYLAQQDDPATTRHGAENPFDSLIALYFVLQNPRLGVSVVEPVKVEPDPNTGQLVATLDDNLQVPFSHFEMHLRTGARSALITPGACGTYTTKAQLTPWANQEDPLSTTASFKVTRGVGGGPCPAGGVQPFNPHFEAGALNNNAASFSPFNMRLIREDGEQDMTKFSATLPPGELGSLKGVAKCPDSAIAIAKAKTARQELASSSCPQNSLIGHTVAGAGVGNSLTYVKGFVYLGGPYHGDPLSVIAVTPALAGPFDAGTVVVQEALTLNPKTAEVEVDGANSDPIPHILKGIVLKLRDLRVYVDRPDFTLNPTSCDESKARSVLFGSYLNALDPSDDKPVDLSTRYQAANCANLGFKPKLDLKLKGGTKRGGHPSLTATYTPRKGDANVKDLVVRLPRSAFLDQGHIRTICTRVQFAAKACPPAARYGFIKAWTPLLDEPLEGPVYLRSSNHKLPDLVFDLKGLVDVEVSTRIDSFKGGIRATVEDAPDAPISKVLLKMQGQKKGLIVNSTDLCLGSHRADVLGTGQNGKQSSSKPLMRAGCGGRGRKHSQAG
jgi:hypothetical protein